MPRDLQSVLDAVLDGILLLDDEGRIEQVNTEGCRLLEASAESITGQAVERVLGSNHELAALVKRVADTRQSAIRDEVALERRLGEDLIVDISASPLFEEKEGRFRGTVVVMRDRTISRSLREEVAQREQLTSYGHIAAGIAHEVKNPLGGIRGAAELISRWSDDERANRAAELIVSEVDRIADLVEELMVFARGDELEIAMVNLHQVLDEVIDLARMDPLCQGKTIKRIYDPSIPEFAADADRLKQVFLNLVRNALQAMDEGGDRLEISTRMTLDHRLTAQDGRRLPTVQVCIHDSGRGIAPEILDRLTTPFFTTRKKGTGLGLAVSHHWITRHRGSLRFTSEPGQGTSVYVNLPLEQRLPGAPSNQEREPS